ncbi:MAG: PLDc N-terminal domain-containing protein [Desulfurococcales archaeon]|nr:PLDc N-terminal domain-containing protein [Desulfurococcales archaeon]
MALEGVFIMTGLIGFWLLFILIAILIAVWVYRDAQRRYPGDSTVPLIWLLIVLITGIIGLIVYLIVRPPERREMGREARTI